MFNSLNKENIVADKNFNRWLVPPAALLIHLSIGMIYGFSVFWKRLTQVVGTECGVDVGFFERIFITSCDWRMSDLGWTFSLAIVFLGASAAIFGHWLERAGPRKAGVAAALTWGGGLIISSIGVYFHQLWIIWLGTGVIGGIGLGLGYISPVSTLIKWFPDRRGLATGMAIMGFGGGAMIGSPSAEYLMNHFSTNGSGVWQTFLVLGCTYLVAMLLGAFGYRVPADGWKPEGWVPKVKDNKLISKNHVHVQNAHKTPQFWLLWLVLCLNVSAGIGVLGVASPMFQEVAVSIFDKDSIVAIAAGFVALLSLSNILGRIFWASSSDFLGRKNTYLIFFALGFLMYVLSPWAGSIQNISLFALIFCVILTMYGGGFATIPAYLADIFGTQHVGAIHGRLLTAWSTAGILGPMLVFYLREYQINQGVDPSQAYNLSMYILAGLLVFGFIANILIGPVNKKFHMTKAEVDKESRLVKNVSKIGVSSSSNVGIQKIILPVAWLVVGVPLALAIYNTLDKAIVIFH